MGIAKTKEREAEKPNEKDKEKRKEIMRSVEMKKRYEGKRAGNGRPKKKPRF